jgi:tRNA acetyltransferase TAN1
MGKESRSKYVSNKDFAVPKGSLGFLLTCRRGKERPAAKEAIALLEDWHGNDDEELNKKASENIEEDFEKELEELKEERKNGEFIAVDTKLDCLVFIKCKSIKPVEFITDLLNDFLAKGVRRTKYCSRILPVETTCQASMKEIETAAKLLIDPYFKDCPDVSYAVAQKIRNNSKLKRDELIKGIADLGRFSF